jgi:LAO/AO transport system kinase
VVRTVASENRGVDALAANIAKFREHFAARPERQKKHVEHWKKRLVELLESRLLERALGNPAGQAQLDQLASAVAERRKDPFTAVNEILARSGLGA